MDTRRSFIKKITAPLVAVPLVAARIFDEKKSSPYDGPVLRVAIMGLGSYGTRVADAMLACSRAKLTGAISGTPSKLSAWQSKYSIPEKNCYNYENFDALRDNPDIDAVYIITPNALHKEQAIRVAKAGKHVICEKPMALRAQDCRDMIRACNDAGVKLLIGYRMHFEPCTLEIIKHRNAGGLGKIKFFQGLSGFRIGDPGQWRLNKALSGGGSLMDIGIYSVNGARYMTGEEPSWVTAQEIKTDPVKFKEGVDETITFQFGFPSGAIASCLSSYSMNGLDKFFLNGESGIAEMQPATNYGPIKARIDKKELVHEHVVHQTRQMDEMATIILDNKQPVLPMDGEEGLRDVVIIEAIYKAVKTGKKVMLRHS